MATEITGYLLLSKSQPDNLIFNRDVQFILSLDEGHDRAVWQWVKIGNSKTVSKAWVPEKPSTILRDGLLMFLAEGAQNAEVISALSRRKAKRVGVVDLNHLPIDEHVYKNLGAKFSGLNIAVVAFPGSSLLNQVEKFSEEGLSICVLAEQPLAVESRSPRQDFRELDEVRV